MSFRAGEAVVSIDIENGFVVYFEKDYYKK